MRVKCLTESGTESASIEGVRCIQISDCHFCSSVPQVGGAAVQARSRWASQTQVQLQFQVA
jgi:hypothetical protein